MTTYSGNQISNLQSQLNGAQAALDQGNTSLAQQHISNYYSSQSFAGRGYTPLAQEVVSNNTAFGRVANENLVNGLKAAGLDVSEVGRLRISLELARADFSTIQENGGTIPTMSQIEKYHVQTFMLLGINPTYWGEFSFSATNIGGACQGTDPPTVGASHAPVRRPGGLLSHVPPPPAGQGRARVRRNALGSRTPRRYLTLTTAPA